MQVNRYYFKTLCFIFCALCITPCLKAQDKKTKTEVVQEKEVEIIEDKTGISAKNNRTLASLYAEAVEWLKTPYRRGGMSAKGMDCSGLASTIYKNVFDVKLQRVSSSISKVDVDDLSKDELVPGDLVFFATSRRAKGVNHVGVYLGNNHFVHASVSRGVIISNLDEAYYKRTWVKGGRVKANSSIFDNLLAKQEKVQVEDISSQPVLINNIKPTHTPPQVMPLDTRLNMF